jgi:hypothetical protein
MLRKNHDTIKEKSKVPVFGHGKALLQINRGQGAI